MFIILVEKFIENVANNLTIVKVIKFFFNNKNTIDNEKGLSVWLNIEKEKLKEVLEVLLEYEILKFEFGMYIYSPNEEMKKLVEDFIKYYEKNNKEYIEKISKINFKEKELEKRLKEMTQILFEKNRVLYIIQEINNIINSPEILAKILESLWTLIKKHVNVDIISIRYNLPNLKGIKVICENKEIKDEVYKILFNEDSCLAEKGSKLKMCKEFTLHSFDLIGEKAENIGTLLLGTLYGKEKDLEKDMNLIEVLSSLITQMLEKQNYFFEKIKKEKLESDLELAKKIQLSYIPKKFPEIEGIEFAAIYQSAKLVGGDYYDWFKINAGKYAFVMGDVSGKGSAAALFMVKVRENFRIFSKRDIDPEKVLEDVNKNLTDDVDVEKFMTAFYSVIDFEKNIMTFSNAGHDPMLLLRNEKIYEYKTKGIPLGIMEEAKYQKGEMKLEKGDLIILYTDGVVEARNEEKEFYGFERFKEILIKHNRKNVNEIAKEIKEDVEKFNGFISQHDDFTLLLIKY